MLKDIPGYEGIYRASSSGKIYSIRTWKERVTINSIYLTITLSNKGINKMFTVHSLIALTFLGDRPHGMHINHKDGNKHNNNIENLEYVTRSENSKHAYRVLGVKNAKSNLGNFYGKAFRKEPVKQYDKNMNEIKSFDCIKRAADELGILDSAIGNCLGGRCKTSGGFIWKYA